MPISQIQQIAIGKLRPNPANIWTHSKKQIAQIARSIEQFGFVVPAVADEQLSSSQVMLGLRQERHLGCGPCPSSFCQVPATPNVEPIFLLTIS